MAIGTFIFELRTVAFGSVQKNHEYRWSSSEIIGNPPVLQALGKGSNKCTLGGIVYHKNQPLENLKTLAENQKPLIMVDGTGGVHGNWIIRQINETESYFDKF
ncbi:MAG: phage tail protein, partial [Alphaproteobacteria bacterium]|nr:phage tail protein [Alphaproteobacteria bacterium]